MLLHLGRRDRLRYTPPRNSHNMRLSARVEVDIVANNPERQQAARNWGGGVGAVQG
jgi:hypothetical protein